MQQFVTCVTASFLQISYLIGEGKIKGGNHMANINLMDFLKDNGVEYQVWPHLQTFTSAETAQMANISGKKMLKPVLVELEGKNVMIVVPSNRTVDLFKLNAFFKAKNVRIKEKEEICTLFPDCHNSAIPPLGILYWIPTYVDESILDEGKVCFNVGTTYEVVEISTKDFLRISRSVVGDFSVAGKKLKDKRKKENV